MRMIVLDHSTIVDNEHAIVIQHGVQFVRHRYDSAVRVLRANRVSHERVFFWIDACRGFVQNDDSRMFENRSSQAQKLSFASTETLTSL
ncbi:unnamed protein product [Trichogramma brassicae]|uniref:Uncharacterized protein n=1 Tax=Trichogramma brassicae TaxID=86971 RepID=A0A6H5IC48_9HYME|nr:unnamed protein product [Trichogramma brassicae]